MSDFKATKVSSITMTSARLANGKKLSKGKAYRVPADVSENDASYLLTMGHAVAAPDKGAKAGDKSAQ